MRSRVHPLRPVWLQSADNLLPDGRPLQLLVWLVADPLVVQVGRSLVLPQVEGRWWVLKVYPDGGKVSPRVLKGCATGVESADVRGYADVQALGASQPAPLTPPAELTVRTFPRRGPLSPETKAKISARMAEIRAARPWSTTPRTST